jgi:hypothetical protein
VTFSATSIRYPLPVEGDIAEKLDGARFSRCASVQNAKVAVDFVDAKWIEPCRRSLAQPGVKRKERRRITTAPFLFSYSGFRPSSE